MLQCDPLSFTAGFSFTNISQQAAHTDLHSTISNSPIFIQRPSSRDISILTKSKQLFSSIRPCKYNLRSSANIWSASIFWLYAFQKKNNRPSGTSDGGGWVGRHQRNCEQNIQPCLFYSCLLHSLCFKLFFSKRKLISPSNHFTINTASHSYSWTSLPLSGQDGKWTTGCKSNSLNYVKK